MWNPKGKQSKSIIALFSHRPTTVLYCIQPQQTCVFLKVILHPNRGVTLSNAAANGSILSGGTVKCSLDKFVSDQISGNSCTEQITEECDTQWSIHKYGTELSRQLRSVIPSRLSL